MKVKPIWDREAHRLPRERLSGLLHQGGLQAPDVFGGDLVQPPHTESWQQLQAEDRFLGRQTARLVLVGRDLVVKKSRRELLQRRHFVTCPRPRTASGSRSSTSTHSLWCAPTASFDGRGEWTAMPQFGAGIRVPFPVSATAAAPGLCGVRLLRPEDARTK